MAYFVGVDVGSGSARSAVFDDHGEALSHSVQRIKQFRPQQGFVEQSSADIWSAVAKCVKEAVVLSGVSTKQIISIGFDATCSLVALDKNFEPVSVSPTQNPQNNIVMWMDHRADGEAAFINQQNHDCLKYVGGEVSLEMQLPKILWLKHHQPQLYADIDLLLDLSDFLVFTATGKVQRSSCTMSCKWNFLSHENQWAEGFLEQIGLDTERDHHKLRGDILPVATKAGELSEWAAQELGLEIGTIVATGIIDAHAGGLATIGQQPDALAVISGTSTCLMASSKQLRFVPGIWGPYWNAMLPAAWLLEGGQSATGALIDSVIKVPELVTMADQQALNIFDLLNNKIIEMEAKETNLTSAIHVLDYHHGNRTPRADSSLTGMVSGLSLDTSLDEYAKQYLATIQSIHYGTKHIIETLQVSGCKIEEIRLSGGATKNALLIRELADITGLPVVLSKEPEAVLLGAAVMAAVASDYFSNIDQALESMTHQAHVVMPNTERRSFHKAKYAVYLKMYEHQLQYRTIMDY